MTIAPAALAPDDALAQTISSRLDDGPWNLELEADSLRVYSARVDYAPVVAYRTWTEHAAPAEALVAFLGAGLFDAFALLNARYAFGEVLRDDPLVVRTGFTMPPGMANREFVHTLSVTPLGEGGWVVGYDAADEAGLPPARPGYVRCPMYPSGQRIRALGERRACVEHLMVYELSGRVPRWAQNRLFHRGHVQAYRDEWSALVAHSRADMST